MSAGVLARTRGRNVRGLPQPEKQMEPQTSAANPMQLEQVEDFVSGYANNIQFEPSAWDLKIVFGELSQTAAKAVVEQHTSITISWLQAKMLDFYLRVQIAAHELEDGKIQVPERVLPPEPPPLPPDIPNREAAERMRKAYLDLRERLLSGL
jgi:hypothetical protein